MLAMMIVMVLIVVKMMNILTNAVEFMLLPKTKENEVYHFLNYSHLAFSYFLQNITHEALDIEPYQTSSIHSKQLFPFKFFYYTSVIVKFSTFNSYLPQHWLNFKELMIYDIPYTSK